MSHPPLEDDNLRRRFIVDDLDDEERRPIEERMFTDSSYFESLAALEHEMLIDLARGRLDARWARPLTASLAASPDRQRHLEEVELMLETLPKTSSPSRALWYRWAAAAVIILATAGAVRWGVMSRDAGVTTPPAPLTLPSYVLQPGPTRSASDSGNLIDLSRTTGAVRLVAVLDAPNDAVVIARAKPVGGDYLQMPRATTSHRVADGLEVTWEVPAVAWTAGDYLIEYSAESGSRGGAIIGTRFVRIER